MSKGGLGDAALSAQHEPNYLRHVRGGIRDVRLIRTLLRRPDWQMPEGAEKALPVELYLIAHDRGRDGKPAGHKVNTRIKAIEVLQSMKRDNERKLTAGVRLNQIGERTRLMAEHPELLQGGSATNVTNHVQVVVYLPEKADHSEFALPSERPAIDVQSKPAG